jgi:hypothetical protein
MKTLIKTHILGIAVLACATGLWAHHGYAEYDRNAPVTLEGTVKRVLWANPHVVLTLETETKGDYSVEWNAVYQLSRFDIKSDSVKEGDHLIITGSINRNPEKRILTIIQEIRRPADGWHWENPNRTNLNSATK